MLIFHSIFSIILALMTILSVFKIENIPFFLETTVFLSVIVLFILELKVKNVRLTLISLAFPIIGVGIFFLLQVPLEITQLLSLALVFFIINSFYEKWQQHFFIVLLVLFSVIAVLIALFFNHFQFSNNFIILSLIVLPLGVYLLLQTQKRLGKLVVFISLIILIFPVFDFNFNIFQLDTLNGLSLSLLIVTILLIIGIVFVFFLNALKDEKKIFIFLGFSIVLSLFLLNALLFIITVALLFLAIKPLVRVAQKKISKRQLQIFLVISIGYFIFIELGYYQSFQANKYYQLAQSQPLNKAIKTLKIGLDYAKNSDYFEFLGDLYFKKKQLKLAEKVYLNALKINPNPNVETVLGKLATIYQQQNQSKKLIRVLREKLNISKIAVNFSILAKTLRQYGFYNEALAVYKMAYELEKTNADYCYYYGVSLVMVEQYKLAKTILLQGLNLDKSKRFRVILQAIADGKNITLE